ncbi:MAG: hypothetical protein ACXWRE_04205 [Pseudobdellovibrionaceae bacterium]
MRFQICGMILAILGLLGCKEVTVENGQLPQEFLSSAADLVGTYHGNFNGNDSTIEIQLDGDRPTLSYKVPNQMDILSSNCGGKIGNLQKILVADNDNEYGLSGAIFEFLPGACSTTVGREVILTFANKNEFKMSIHQSDKRVYICTAGRSGGCSFKYLPQYIEGVFSR